MPTPRPFRDYDPTIGRYIQSDPYGLLAGPNTYAYALADPFSWVDSTGTGEVGGLIGGIAGGIGGFIGGGGVGAIGGTFIEPGGGTIAGGAIGALEGAGIGFGAGYAIGSSFEDFLYYMAQLGKQNKANEYTREARLQPDPCAWLREQYQKASNSADKRKIETAQKEFGCRNIQKHGKICPDGEG